MGKKETEYSPDDTRIHLPARIAEQVDLAMRLAENSRKHAEETIKRILIDSPDDPRPDLTKKIREGLLNGEIGISHFAHPPSFYTKKMLLAEQRADEIFAWLENVEINGINTEFDSRPSTIGNLVAVFTMLAVVARTDKSTRSKAESIQQLFRSQAARHAANEKHENNGNRAKQHAIREAWASGKFKSRDICAEQECAALEMSFSAARKALRNTPDPT